MTEVDEDTLVTLSKGLVAPAGEGTASRSSMGRGRGCQMMRAVCGQSQVARGCDYESILAAGSDAVSRESLDDVLVCEGDLSNDESDVRTNERR